MPLPPSVTRVRRNGVEFISDVDRAKYTLTELTRAALRDCGRFLIFKMRDKVRKIANNSLKRSRRVKNAFQFWNRRQETDLIVGIRHDTWYGVEQELGTNGQPKRDILRQTVIENIDELERIQARYLQHIEDDIAARQFIDENAEGDNEDE